jgi:sugar/nucleoside kinase (ribokinase family)
MVCKLGTDVFGVEMKKNFESYNVKTDFIFTTDKASSGVALISVADDGYLFSLVFFI